MRRIVRTRWVYIGTALACLLLIGAYAVFRTAVLPAEQSLLSTTEGAPFVDYDGRAWELADLKGEPVVVYMWASWCPYCGAELEHLAFLAEEYADVVHVVAINRAESLRTARAFTDTRTLGQRMLLLLDEGDIFYANMGGYAMPEAVFIDRAGSVAHHLRGPLNREEVERLFAEIR